MSLEYWIARSSRAMTAVDAREQIARRGIVDHTRGRAIRNKSPTKPP